MLVVIGLQSSVSILNFRASLPRVCFSIYLSLFSCIGERTFGVLTKLDLMDQGTNALDVGFSLYMSIFTCVLLSVLLVWSSFTTASTLCGPET